jgi:hypothetical protein
VSTAASRRTSQNSFAIDHILAEQHGGRATRANLALACGFCNRHKGPNIAGIDPKSGRLTRLFNPRRERWSAHFRQRGPQIIGVTPVGRATVVVLAMNHSEQLMVRRALIAEGLVSQPR